MLHQIGVGVLGPVFRTYDPQRDRLVAVKAFRLDITPEQGRALADEFERVVALGLSHPSLVAPIATGVEGTVAYLALEYVAAESLDVAMRNYAPGTVGKVLPFITQIAGGIDFACAAGVGHGTLHPRDIFVTPDVARATGFGVASALERIGYRPPVRRPYSAPERVAGGDWTTPADLFSLAAITQELLTGHRLLGTGDQAMAAGTDFGPDVDSETVRGVLKRALAEKPSERYPTALAFANALESAVHRYPADAPVSLPLFVSESSSPLLPRPTPIETDVTGGTPVVSAKLDVFAAARVEQGSAKSVASAPGTIEPLEREPELYIHQVPAAETMQRPRASTVAADEHPRPMMVPFALTAMVSLLVGFVIGYGVGNRSWMPATVLPTQVPAASVQPASSQQLERPLSEVTVTEALTAVPPAAPVATPTSVAPAAAAKPPVPSVEAPATRTNTERAVRSEPASPGRMLIRSTPAGADVLVDGKPRGVTPLALRDLAYGTYAIRVTRAGYVAETRRIAVSRSRPAASVTISLRQERLPATGGTTGAVFVDSQPRGARVEIDGRAAGTTPLLVSGLVAGAHLVRIEHDGYREWSTSVRIGTGGAPARVTASLERVPQQ